MKRTRKRKPAPLSDQLRHIIEHCGISRYAISQASGVDEGQLSKFVSGKVGLGSNAMDRVGVALGLRLVRD